MGMRGIDPDVWFETREERTLTIASDGIRVTDVVLFVNSLLLERLGCCSVRENLP
jgi:hypothetical protein